MLTQSIQHLASTITLQDVFKITHSLDTRVHDTNYKYNTNWGNWNSMIQCWEQNNFSYIQECRIWYRHNNNKTEQLHSVIVLLQWTVCDCNTVTLTCLNMKKYQQYKYLEYFSPVSNEGSNVNGIIFDTSTHYTYQLSNFTLSCVSYSLLFISCLEVSALHQRLNFNYNVVSCFLRFPIQPQDRSVSIHTAWLHVSYYRVLSYTSSVYSGSYNTQIYKSDSTAFFRLRAG